MEQKFGQNLGQNLDKILFSLLNVYSIIRCIRNKEIGFGLKLRQKKKK